MMETVQIKVSNVKCQGCAGAITAGLREQAGITGVTVDVAAGEVTVSGEGLDAARLSEKLAALGYPPAA